MWIFTCRVYGSIFKSYQQSNHKGYTGDYRNSNFSEIVEEGARKRLYCILILLCLAKRSIEKSFMGIIARLERISTLYTIVPSIYKQTANKTNRHDTVVLKAPSKYKIYSMITVVNLYYTPSGKFNINNMIILRLNGCEI